MRRMVEAKPLRIIVLLAPGNRLSVDINANIEADETVAPEVVVAQPMRPPAATGADIEDARPCSRQAFGKRKHPEITSMHQEVRLVVEDAVADPDAHTQVIGWQVAKFRIDQLGN